MISNSNIKRYRMYLIEVELIIHTLNDQCLFLTIKDIYIYIYKTLVIKL